VELDYVVVSSPPSSQAAPSAAWQWDDVPGRVLFTRADHPVTF
jgi:hypothetical protein